MGEVVNEKYRVFLDVLNQITQDQQLYETELIHQDEYKGIRHEEIIKLGSVLCKRLRKFAEKGETFMEDLPSPDILPKFTDAITSYQNLIVPPKVFGGFCPCLKPARDGPEYDRKFFITKCKMVAAIFISYAILIQNKCEEIVNKSSHYDVYVDDMNKVFNHLSEIKCTNSEPKHLENIRRKLSVALEATDRFIQLHGDRTGKIEFKTEALRSLKKVQDLLTAKPQTPSPTVNPDGTTTSGSVPIGRRILIKAQATMQEIMNSAAAISATEAKEQLEVLDNLAKTLKKSRESEVTQFNSMEEQMHELNIVEVLNRLREDSEVIYSDANSKTRDSIKRWTAIKNKSTQRKVAEYTDDNGSSFNPISIGNQNPSGLPNLPIKPIKNIADIGRSTTVKMNEFGKKTKDVFETAGGEIVAGFTNVKNTGAGAVKKVGNLLSGGESSDGSSHGNEKKNGSSSATPTNNGLKLTNPFEGVANAISGHPAKESKSSTKKSDSGFKFNPLDAF